MNALPLLAQGSSSGSPLSLLVFLIPAGLFVYMMVVSPRKQRQKHQAFVNSIEVGTDVVTAGGLYGTVNFIEDGICHLEVDNDVVVRVSMSSLSRVAGEPEMPAKGKPEAPVTGEPETPAKGGSPATPPDDTESADEETGGSAR